MNIENIFLISKIKILSEIKVFIISQQKQNFVFSRQKKKFNSLMSFNKIRKQILDKLQFQDKIFLGIFNQKIFKNILSDAQ